MALLRVHKRAGCLVATSQLCHVAQVGPGSVPCCVLQARAEVWARGALDWLLGHLCSHTQGTATLGEGMRALQGSEALG